MSIRWHSSGHEKGGSCWIAHFLNPQASGVNTVSAAGHVASSFDYTADAATLMHACTHALSSTCATSRDLSGNAALLRNNILQQDTLSIQESPQDMICKKVEGMVASKK